MSDISDQNAARMIVESKRMYAVVSELRGMIEAQNAKITTLVNELATIKQAQIMAAVNAQIAAKGNGGTA